MQDSAVLSDVNVLAGKHAVAQIQDPRLLGERKEVPHQGRAHEVLRQVDMQVGGLEREGLRTLRIIREHLA